MSECGCEGSCPQCRIGEVDDHKCDHCGVEYCPKCHGYIIGTIKYKPMINPCLCEDGGEIRGNG